LFSVSSWLVDEANELLVMFLTSPPNFLVVFGHAIGLAFLEIWSCHRGHVLRSKRVPLFGILTSDLGQLCPAAFVQARGSAA